MAGTDLTGAFNSADFRAAIRSTMTMGAAVDPTQQVIFIFSEQATYNPEDPDANPYDWKQGPVTDIAERELTVPAAVQYATSTIVGTTIGDFDATRAVLTLLDVDWALVKSADQVKIGGAHYVLDPPGWIPLALFDVGVYQIHCSARG